MPDTQPQQSNLLSFPQRKDYELLLAYTNGDAKAFDQFYDRYKKPLYNHAMKFTSFIPADAEDVLMDVFLKFMQLLLNDGTNEETIKEKFGNDGSAVAYLYTMIRNKAISMHRLAYKQYEVSFEKQSNEDDEKNTKLEIPDTGSLEETRALELNTAVHSYFWLPVGQIEKSIQSAKSTFDRGRLTKELDKERKQAESLSQIYDLLMAGSSLEKIAKFIGIDRKTLLSRRQLIAKRLKPILQELN